MVRLAVENMDFVPGMNQLCNQQTSDELRTADHQDALGFWGFGLQRSLFVCAAGSARYSWPGHLLTNTLDAPPLETSLIVVFEAQMRDEVFTLHPTKRIFQLH